MEMIWVSQSERNRSTTRRSMSELQCNCTTDFFQLSQFIMDIIKPQISSSIPMIWISVHYQKDTNHSSSLERRSPHSLHPPHPPPLQLMISSPNLHPRSTLPLLLSHSVLSLLLQSNVLQVRVVGANRVAMAITDSLL